MRLLCIFISIFSLLALSACDPENENLKRVTAKVGEYENKAADHLTEKSLKRLEARTWKWGKGLYSKYISGDKRTRKRRYNAFLDRPIRRKTYNVPPPIPAGIQEAANEPVDLE